MNETWLMPLIALTIGGGIVSSLFIGGLVPGTFPYLSRQIRSLSKQERLMALVGLGRLGTEKATNLLIATLHHPELDMRRVATESLALTGSPSAIEPLGALLDDSNPVIRRSAALSLNAFSGPRATTFLCQALRDSEESVATAAALSLAKRRDPEAIESLCRALSGSAEVARVVSKALVAYGMDAFETLCKLLPEAGAVSSERIIDIMTTINPEGSIEPLMQALDTARVEATVKSAIQALSALNAPGLLERLCQILQEPHALGRLEAITALRALDRPQGIRAIAQVLSDPDPELRRAAVLALAGHGDPLVTEALCKALADDDSLVVRYAANALGQQRDPRILRSFFEALYPQETDCVIPAIENALKRPLEDLESARDFLPILERWAGPSARQDDQTARYLMQSALILLHGRLVRGFRDLTSTILVFKGHDWSSVTSEDRLHPLAASSVEYLRTPREVRQFQAVKAQA